MRSTFFIFLWRLSGATFRVDHCFVGHIRVLFEVEVAGSILRDLPAILYELTDYEIAIVDA